MQYKQTSAPSVEPVTLAEAKKHLNVTFSDDDDYISALIKVARQTAEDYTNRQLITATWKAYLDEFPIHDTQVIELMHCPVAAITSITYTDTSGETQTWAAADYQLDIVSEPARILPAYNKAYPTAREQMNAVEITFTCGYGSTGASVPDRIKQAILLMIGHWYENREDVIVGRIATALPMTSKFLLSDYRIQSI